MATGVDQRLDRAGLWEGPYPSGAPAIFVDQAARLGQPCGLVSCVGDDAFGRLNVDRLRTDGVDVGAIATDREAATGSAFVRYRADGDRDFVFNMRHSACRSIAMTPAAEAMLGGCDHLHVMGSSLFSAAMIAATRRAMEIVRGRGGTLSFDPNLRPELLGAGAARDLMGFVLERCDVFLPSGEELFLFSDARDEAGAVADLLARGVGQVVVKRGAAGSSGFTATGRTDAPGLRVEEMDPTGAGDCFGAAYVTFWLRGVGVADCLRMANASGAHAVTRRGPMEGAATLAELQSLLGSPP